VTFSATSPVHFHFKRSGGAIVGARISVWSGVGGANPKRVAVVNFTHPTSAAEDESVVLDSGNYTCVLKVFVHKDLNGRYAFNVEVDSQRVFPADPHGDVSQDPDEATIVNSQFDVAVA
jgi:hypothetical protein